MIPKEWRPCRRESDGEIVGYLVPDETDPALAVPTTLIGTALGPAQPTDSARTVLLARGLASLAQRWWCRLPKPLPSGLTTADPPAPDWGWRPVVLVEVSPARSRIRIEMAAPEELRIQVVLPNPVGDLLRTSPPE